MTTSTATSLRLHVGPHRGESRPWLALCWTVLAASALVTLTTLAMTDPLDRFLDLSIYRGAVGDALDGGSLYEHRSTVRADLGFTYPPFAAVVLAPLTAGTKDVAGLTWAALNLLLVAWLVSVAWRELPPTRAGAAGTGWYLLAVAAAWQLAPVNTVVHLGQVGVVLAAAVVADVVAMRNGRRWAGLATGLAAAVKLTPLIFVPLFWLAGRRRAAVVAAATFTGCTLGAHLLFAADSASFWSTYLFDTERVGTELAAANNALTSLVARSELARPGRVALWVGLAAVVVVVGLTRSGRLARAGGLLPAVVAVSCLGVVAAPISWTHHAVLAVLALPLLLVRRRDDPLFGFGLLLAIALFDPFHRGWWAATSMLRAVLYTLVAVAPAILRPPGELWLLPQLTGSSRRR